MWVVIVRVGAKVTPRILISETLCIEAVKSGGETSGGAPSEYRIISLHFEILTNILFWEVQWII